MINIKKFIAFQSIWKKKPFFLSLLLSFSLTLDVIISFLEVLVLRHHPICSDMDLNPYELAFYHYSFLNFVVVFWV